VPVTVVEVAKLLGVLLASGRSKHPVQAGLRPVGAEEKFELKRQGLPVAELAERTGLYESSVRRILYKPVKRLAAARRIARSPTP
jgi:hypothetical protein